MKEDRTVQEAFKLLLQQLGHVLAYYSLMLLVGAIFGWLARFIVRYFKLDRRFLWLRYDNQWHYLLTGEILEMPDLQTSIGIPNASAIDFIFVDVLLKLEKANMLYSGVLVDYELAVDGGLRTIYLRQARRKALTNSKSAESSAADDLSREEELVAMEKASESEESYYDVAGDLMVIPYSQIINLNLSYYVDVVNDTAEINQPQFEVTVVPAGITKAGALSDEETSPVP